MDELTDKRWMFVVIIASLLITSCATLAGIPPEERDEPTVEREETRVETEEPTKVESEYRIVTLLPKDAIPSIDNPQFYPVEEADEEYDPNEIVIGVEFDGEARAYSANMLSSHEIVNDVVAGVPIAVTW